MSVYVVFILQKLTTIQITAEPAHVTKTRHYIWLLYCTDYCGSCRMYLSKEHAIVQFYFVHINNTVQITAVPIQYTCHKNTSVQFYILHINNTVQISAVPIQYTCYKNTLVQFYFVHINNTVQITAVPIQYTCHKNTSVCVVFPLYIVRLLYSLLQYLYSSA